VRFKECVQWILWIYTDAAPECLMFDVLMLSIWLVVIDWLFWVLHTSLLCRCSFTLSSHATARKSSYRCIRDRWFRFSFRVFGVFCWLMSACSLWGFFLCVFGVFSPVCFVLSVPVQVIVWKDSSRKWPIICRAGRKTLLTHSLKSIYICGPIVSQDTVFNNLIRHPQTQQTTFSPIFVVQQNS